MCPRFQKLIETYLARQLSLEGARKVELHLTLCQPCRVAVEKIQPEALTVRPIPEAVDDQTFANLRVAIGQELLGEKKPPGSKRVWRMLPSGFRGLTRTAQESES
ncbi:MAG: zf-HC2 domain-containing protein [Bryobacteraceae bacterium]